MKITKVGEIVEGFKATDKDMKCQGFQFGLGKWYEHDAAVEMCKSGFHFCPHPSGVWSYYPADSRVFKVQAQIVHQEYAPGADLKYVCKMIKFVEEVKIGGDSNTGNSNTGYRNTGDRNTDNGNTGNSNTGYRNTGNGNTGYRNTGYRNTGNGNTGNWNTGDRNTGNWNTGNWNTGNWNTGYRNTGDRNTGDWNTGNWNTTNRSSGLFCQVEPCVICFDVKTKLTFDKFCEKYPQYMELGRKLNGNEPFDYAEFKTLPGWTLEKCKSLHEKMIKARSEN